MREEVNLAGPPAGTETVGRFTSDSTEYLERHLATVGGGQKTLLKLAAKFAKLARMMNKQTTAKQSDRSTQAKAEFAKLMENISGRGFFGTASVTVNVQDGHIQYTRVCVDRMVK